MRRALSRFLVGLVTTVLVGLPAFAQSPPEVTLTRIDCGTGATPTDVGQRTGDKDVFGDGSVIVLRMPGHTPGHSCLLVRLKDMGPVLLTGDLVHFRENYETNGVPSFNFDRAATVASIERMKQIAANLKATVIIQHDMRDIGKLPAFPAAAK